MKFKHNIKAIYISLDNFPMEMATTIDGEPEMVNSDAVVHFSVELEAKEWGVKDVITHVSTIEIAVGDHELCIKQNEPCIIDGVNDDQWEIEVDLNLHGREKLYIYPIDIELDWAKKKAYVNF